MGEENRRGGSERGERRGEKDEAVAGKACNRREESGDGPREGNGRCERGCERVAGFPGFVVIATKPPLHQTRQRFAFTDGNEHTNAETGEERG